MDARRRSNVNIGFEVLRLSRALVGGREAEAVSRVLLEDGYLGMGKEVRLFETELAAYLGIPSERVVCVNSGTAALHLAVAAVTSPGDEVLLPSLTYVASFQACTAAGTRPVPCEADPETMLLDLKDAEKRLTNRTKAIMPVHYAGFPGDLTAVYDFAEAHGLRVIEDAAHAFGCLHRGKKIGAFGDIVCFSFDGIKNITCGEGGALVTADARAAAFARDTRLLGIKKDTDKRYAGGRSWDFDVTHQGYRYHMNNMHAAVGRVQLKRFSAELAPKRVELADLYRDRLDALSSVRLPNRLWRGVVPHIQPVRVLGGGRNELRGFLAERGVETGIHYKPNHLLSFFGGGRVRLPVTERLYRELLTLPLHPGLAEEDIHRVCDLIMEFFGARRDER